MMKKTVMVMVMMMMAVMNLDIIVNGDDGDDLKGITSVLVIRSIFGHGLLPARGQRLSTPGLFYLTLVKTRQGYLVRFPNSLPGNGLGNQCPKFSILKTLIVDSQGKRDAKLFSHCLIRTSTSLLTLTDVVINYSFSYTRR